MRNLSVSRMKLAAFVAVFSLPLLPAFVNAQAQAQVSPPVPLQTPTQSQSSQLLFPNPVYCGPTAPDKRIFTGVQFDNNQTPKISIAVDPIFEKNILRKERGITGDIPVTPVYDLVVKVTPSINQYCLSQWDASGKFAGEVEPPKTMQFNGSIVIADGTKNGNAILNTSSFVRGSKDADGNWQYEWGIKGWPTGIAPYEKIEVLINAIKNGKPPVNIIVNVPKPNGGQETYSNQTTMSTCAPIGGSGKYGVVSMRGASSDLFVGGIVNFADNLRTDGFGKLDPFASNQSYFSHFADLTNYDDSRATIVRINIVHGKMNVFASTTFSENISSCPGARLYVFLNGLTHAGYANGFGGRGVFLNNTVDNQDANSPKITNVAMHEIGHAFAALNDEYTALYYAESISESLFLSSFGKNCTTAPNTAYRYDLKLYGGLKIYGCSIANRDNFVTYRPSAGSIMYYGGKFNVVSCGWIMAAIMGTDSGKQYFPYCWNLKGLQDSGYSYEAQTKTIPKETPVRMPIENPTNNSIIIPFNEVQNTNQAAAVQNILNSHGNPQFLIVDNFDSNNPQGAIIELDKNGNIPTDVLDGASESSTPTPTPKSQNLLIRAFSNISATFSNAVSSAVSFVNNVISPIRPNPSSVIPITPSLSPTSNPSPTPDSHPAPSPHTAPITCPAGYVWNFGFCQKIPAPSAMPTVSPNALPTPSPAHSSMPSVIPTPTPYNSSIPTPTPTPYHSPTPSPTPTYYPTLTPTPTYYYSTPASSPTPTPTPTPYQTPTPSPTPSPTLSPTPSYSPTPSPMPTPSLAPSPTPSSLPLPSSSPGASLNQYSFTAAISAAINSIEKYLQAR